MCVPLWTVPWVVPWIVVLWAAAALLATGLGLGAMRCFGTFDPLRRPDAEPSVAKAFEALWTGVGVTLALLAAWHLVLPVDARVLGLLAVVSVCGWLAGWPETRQTLRLPALDRPGAWALVALALALWGAARALGPLQQFDTGFYHLQSLEWIRAWPAVPGLGNLHGRLAFNSSFTLLAALWDTLTPLLPAPVEGWRLANGWLLTLALLHTSWAVSEVVRDTPTGRRLPIRFLACGVALPIADLAGGHATSLATDLPIDVVGFLLLYALLELLSAQREETTVRPRFTFLAVLAATAVAIKLSAAPAAAVALAVAAVRVVRRHPAARGEIVRSAALVVLLLLPWTARSVVQSGHLLYPVADTSVASLADLDWAVPRSLTLDESAWIYALAATNLPYHWVEVRESWSWLGSWWDLVGWEVPLLATFCALAGLVAARRRHTWVARYLPALLPIVASLLVWATRAPDPRFAGTFLVALAALLALFALPDRDPRSNRRSAGIAVTVAALWALPTAILGGGYGDIVPTCTIPDAPTRVETTDEGTRVTVTDERLLCWAAPLPCTPYFRPDLEARGPTPGHGYRLDPSIVYADLEEPIPPQITTDPHLGVALFSGWRDLELTEGRAVFGADARLLIYSRDQTRARLRFRVVRLLRGASEIESGTLRIEQDGRPVAEQTIRPGDEVEVLLELQPDHNLARLRFVPDGEVAEGLAFPAVEIEAGRLEEE